MKASDLQRVIGRMVREELKRALPQMLSEMYVKKLVSEGVGIPAKRPAPAPQRQPVPSKKTPSSLAKQLMEEFDQSAGDWYGGEQEEAPQVSRDSVERPIAASLAQKANALRNAGSMFADMIDDDTLDSIQNGDMIESGIPLEHVEAKAGLDFSRMEKMASLMEQKSSQKAPMKNSVEAEERRIEMQRKRLENIKVG